MREKISKLTYYPGNDISSPTIEADVNIYTCYITTCVIDVETLLRGRKTFPCGNGDDYTLSETEQKQIIAFYKKEEQKRQDKLQEREEEER